MLTGNESQITNHGMKFILLEESERIADIQIQPINASKGALQQFCNIFSEKCNLVNGDFWDLEEVLSSIPDLKQDYENCYVDAKSYVLPVEIVHQKNISLERIHPDDIKGYENPSNALARITELKEAYLLPQYNEQMDYVVLHRKIRGKDIGVYSIFGQKYLLVGHEKKGNLLSPSQLIILFMGLFALGYLSRYRPETWNPFIRNDETGERLVIEKFLTICIRFFPNLILNAIYNSRIQFVYETEKVLDLKPQLTKSDLKELLAEIKQEP